MDVTIRQKPGGRWSVETFHLDEWHIVGFPNRAEADAYAAGLWEGSALEREAQAIDRQDGSHVTTKEACG